MKKLLLLISIMVAMTSCINKKEVIVDLQKSYNTVYCVNEYNYIVIDSVNCTYHISLDANHNDKYIKIKIK